MKPFLKVTTFTLIILSLTAGLFLIIIRQDIRKISYNPQAKISQDLSINLAEGFTPQEAIAGVPIINPTATDKLFVIIYDNNEKVAGTTADFNGKVPVLPKSVFEYTKNIAEKRMIWEPYPGVRIAAVINRYGGENPGYILAGVNSDKTDKKINDLNFKIFKLGVYGIFVSVIAGLIASFSTRILKPR